VTDNTRLNIVNVRERIKMNVASSVTSFHRDDGKEMELDIIASSKCGRTILVEVKKTQEKTSLNIVEDFQEKVEIYRKQFPE
jgi:tryptophanyl-tRNA synthetase